MRAVNVVFIGFGQMGKFGYKALTELAEEFRKEHVDLRLVVVEADKKVVETVQKFVDVEKVAFLDTSTPDQQVVHEVINSQFKLTSEDQFLVYDASPTHIHYKNLLAIAQKFPRAAYLGEKPLVTEHAQLKIVEKLGTPLFCDFVETENQAVLTLRSMISRHELDINKLSFWRLNSIGLAKLFNPSARRGVTGGSLLDKCIHDLAVTVCLLKSMPGTKNWSYVVEAAAPLALMPHSLDVDDAGCFSTTAAGFSTRNIPLGLVTGNSEKPWITDAAGFAQLQWRGVSNVLANYHYSWIGVEHFDDLATRADVSSLRERLGKLGILEDQWFSTHTTDVDLLHTFDMEDARVLVVEGSKKGKPVTIVVNMLRRDPIKPFIFLKVGNESPDMVKVEEQPYGDNALARVFKVAVDSLLSEDKKRGNFLSSEVICLVHRALFDIRHNMFGRPYDEKEEWDKALRLIGSQLVPKYPPLIPMARARAVSGR
jgi:predicted dehydrogenase